MFNQCKKCFTVTAIAYESEVGLICGECNMKVAEFGGEGSGNFGHSGREGEVGGSGGDGGGTSIQSAKNLGETSAKDWVKDGKIKNGLLPELQDKQVQVKSGRGSNSGKSGKLKGIVVDSLYGGLGLDIHFDGEQLSRTIPAAGVEFVKPKADINSISIDDAVDNAIRSITSSGGYSHGSPGSSVIRSHLVALGRKDLGGLNAARAKLTGEE